MTDGLMSVDIKKSLNIFLQTKLTLARLSNSVGERRIAQPAGGETSVRAAPGARYLLLTGMVCGQWQ